LLNDNLELPLVLTCDASSCVLGAYLNPYDGGEKPVAFAPRVLTDALKNYSQIDRKAASIIFGVTRSHDYVDSNKIETPFIILRYLD